MDETAASTGGFPNLWHVVLGFRCYKRQVRQQRFRNPCSTEPLADVEAAVSSTRCSVEHEKNADARPTQPLGKAP